MLGIGGPAYATVREFCSSCRQFLRNSHFFRKLRARGIFSPKVDYTSIVTRNDELVFPYTSGIARRPATAATSCCRSTARSTRPSTLGDG